MWCKCRKTSIAMYLTTTIKTSFNTLSNVKILYILKALSRHRLEFGYLAVKFLADQINIFIEYGYDGAAVVFGDPFLLLHPFAMMVGGAGWCWRLEMFGDVWRCLELFGDVWRCIYKHFYKKCYRLLIRGTSYSTETNNGLIFNYFTTGNAIVDLPGGRNVHPLLLWPHAEGCGQDRLDPSSHHGNYRHWNTQYCRQYIPEWGAFLFLIFILYQLLNVIKFIKIIWK